MCHFLGKGTLQPRETHLSFIYRLPPLPPTQSSHHQKCLGSFDDNSVFYIIYLLKSENSSHYEEITILICAKVHFISQFSRTERVMFTFTHIYKVILTCSMNLFVGRGRAFRVNPPLINKCIQMS